MIPSVATTIIRHGVGYEGKEKPLPLVGGMEGGI